MNNLNKKALILSLISVLLIVLFFIFYIVFFETFGKIVFAFCLICICSCLLYLLGSCFYYLFLPKDENEYEDEHHDIDY